MSCRHAPHASGPHHTSRTVAGGTGKHCLLISLIHLIASSVSSQNFHSRFPSHLPLLRSPVHAVLLVVLVGLVALSSTAVTIGRHARSTDQTSMAQMVLSAPRPPSHTHHQPLYVCSWPIVAAPSCMWARRRASRAPWVCLGVSWLLPTLGHVAHGPVSSIDETRQPRVSSIARSRL